MRTAGIEMDRDPEATQCKRTRRPELTESFGPNDAQIRALFAAIADFESEDWLSLTMASMMVDADPKAAEPQYRSMIERQHGMIRLAAQVTDRARKKAMQTGAWQEIEASVLATSGPATALAFDAAARFNPDASRRSSLRQSTRTPVRSGT